MKWYNGVMFILTVTCVGIVLLVLTGCASVDQQYERDNAETQYRKTLSWQDKQEIPNDIEFEEYIVQECNYDDSIKLDISSLWPSSEWENIKLEEDELPKYQILELSNGRKKILFSGDGKDPTKNNKKVLGFTVPESNPNDCIGEVCRGDSVPYLSNYFATGNVDGIEYENFKDWYEREVREAKLRKWTAGKQKYGLDHYVCENVTRLRAKNANKPIEMPKEWMDQWPSLREDKQVDQ